MQGDQVDQGDQGDQVDQVDQVAQGGQVDHGEGSPFLKCVGSIAKIDLAPPLSNGQTWKSPYSPGQRAKKVPLTILASVFTPTPHPLRAMAI